MDNNFFTGKWRKKMNLSERVNQLRQKITDIESRPYLAKLRQQNKMHVRERLDYILDEGSFSWNPCDDCNTNLGGTYYLAHGRDENDDLVHFRVCVDCLFEIQ